MKINYAVPLKETFLENNEFKIRGVAINNCTTRNGVTYNIEELQKAAPTLKNKPVLKDHNNSVDSIVGKTNENCTYDMMNECVNFEAIIKDEKMKEMINEGLITAVSIGAMVEKVNRETENGPLIARGIDFVELSLVAVPADPNAGFQKAIAESFKEEDEEEDDDTVFEKVKEEINMSEDKVLEEKTRILEEQNVSLQTKVKEFEEKEMTALREKYKRLVAEKGVSPKEGYEKLSKEVLEAIIGTLESMKSIEKDETKGVVQESKREENTLKLEREGRVFAIYEENLGKRNLRYSR